eukprot:6944537-Prymnesium_polylepis.2
MPRASVCCVPCTSRSTGSDSGEQVASGVLPPTVRSTIQGVRVVLAPGRASVSMRVCARLRICPCISVSEGNCTERNAIMLCVSVLQSRLKPLETAKIFFASGRGLRRRLRRAQPIFTKKHIHFLHLMGAGPLDGVKGLSRLCFG